MRQSLCLLHAFHHPTEQQLANFIAAQGVSKTAVVEMALQEFLAKPKNMRAMQAKAATLSSKKETQTPAEKLLALSKQFAQRYPKQHFDLKAAVKEGRA